MGQQYNNLEGDLMRHEPDLSKWSTTREITLNRTQWDYVYENKGNGTVEQFLQRCIDRELARLYIERKDGE